jgi:hypothetical protein
MTDFRKDWAARKLDIEARNYALYGEPLPPWPHPRFLNDELEIVAAREISERPLHGVPSVFRREIVSITRVIAEKIANDAVAADAPRRRETTFLSPLDQVAIVRRLADPDTDSFMCRLLRSRLLSHRKYRP